MQRRPRPDFDPQNIAELRALTIALCTQIESDIARFKAGGLTFPDLNQLYYSAHQPQALELITAMTVYVPSGDGRLDVQAEDAHGRLFKSSDHILVSARLSESVAATQLNDTVATLRKLLTYLPPLALPAALTP